MIDATKDKVPLRVLSDTDLRKLVSWYRPELTRHQLEAAALNRGWGSGVPVGVLKEAFDRSKPAP
jgi:hypothetical protein